MTITGLSNPDVKWTLITLSQHVKVAIRRLGTSLVSSELHQLVVLGCRSELHEVSNCPRYEIYEG